jgi:hypothetical protein
MEATEKIISIMTRWLLCDAVLGYQIANGESQECRSPSVLGQPAHGRSFSRRRLSKHSRACEQEESEG